MRTTEILHNRRWAAVLTQALLVLAMLSCQRAEIVPEDPPASDEQPILVAASIAEQLATRAGSDEIYDDPDLDDDDESKWDRGKVTHGHYYLMLHQGNGSTHGAGNSEAYVWSVNDVEIDPRTGYGQAKSSYGSVQVWGFMGYAGSFYLDNVSYEFYRDTQDINNSASPLFKEPHRQWDKFVIFDNEEKPNTFVAGPLKGGEGGNDLLWGEFPYPSSQYKELFVFNFKLHHAMARVRVVVEIDSAGNLPDDEGPDLSDATVEITNVLHEPEMYDRQTGTLYFNRETSLAEGALKYRDEVPVPDDVNAMGSEKFRPIVLAAPGDGTSWASIEGTDDVTTYTTRDFVLPPQALREDDLRPRLTITIPPGKDGKSKSYSGVLPLMMEVEQDGGDSWKPQTLSFLREHILTIRTRITTVPPDLVFMPVTVVDWVDKGHFELTGQQAGIYTEKDFYELIVAYRNNQESGYSRFGDKSGDGKFQFNVYRNLELSDEGLQEYAGSGYPGLTVPGSMAVAGGAGFSFNLTKYSTVTVRYGDESYTGTAGELGLHALMTGTAAGPDEKD